jgi:hypothetical protein
MAHGGSRPPNAVAQPALGFSRLYNTKIQPKCHNNSKKEKRGEEEKGVRRRW